MVDGGTNKDGAIGSALVKKLRSGGCPALKPRFEPRIKDARGGAGSEEEWLFLLLAPASVTPLGMEMHDTPSWLNL